MPFQLACQEGVFARTLYFQFSDGQQRLADFIEEAGVKKKMGLSNVQSLRWQ